jgi:hypothetical protein
MDTSKDRFVTSSPAPRAATGIKRRARSRLSPPWRKALMTGHLISSLGLLGCDLTVLTLGIAGSYGADPVTVYPAAYLIGLVLLVPLALVSLVTGVLQGLLTPWGLARYWWVVGKFVLTVAGVLLGLFVLTPQLALMADAATSMPGVGPSAVARSNTVMDSAAASIVLLVIVVLSVYKPFGRLRGPA